MSTLTTSAHLDERFALTFDTTRQMAGLRLSLADKAVALRRVSVKVQKLAERLVLIRGHLSVGA